MRDAGRTATVVCANGILEAVKQIDAGALLMAPDAASWWRLHEMLLGDEPVTWNGMSRAGLTDQLLHPALEQPGRLPTWVGVGGSPNSVVRAARYGLPLMLAIIGGHPSRFAPYVALSLHLGIELSARPDLLGWSMAALLLSILPRATASSARASAG